MSKLIREKKTSVFVKNTSETQHLTWPFLPSSVQASVFGPVTSLHQAARCPFAGVKTRLVADLPRLGTGQCPALVHVGGNTTYPGFRL